jgi:hypothetical protein
MPNRVTVVAIKDFTYEGRSFEAGHPVSMLPLEALLHAQKRHVSLTREIRSYEKPVLPPTRRRRSRKTAAA